MKYIAIMQPYLFPYIGYFQLIAAAHKFLILDDVHYIKKGWINRNYILLSNRKHLFTLPLKRASQNRLINEIELAVDRTWKSKFLTTIKFGYGKAPYYEETYRLLDDVLNFEDLNLSGFVCKSIQAVCAHLGISTEIIPSSTIYGNHHMKGQDRIIDICAREKAGRYINPIGGTELYTRSDFSDKGIELFFLKTKDVAYKQFDNSFLPSLSIIDVLMFNSKKRISELLQEYELL